MSCGWLWINHALSRVRVARITRKAQRAAVVALERARAESTLGGDQKPDSTMLVFSSQFEMGQGARTGLTTIVAEEFDANCDSIQVANAATPNRHVYRNVRHH